MNLQIIMGLFMILIGISLFVVLSIYFPNPLFLYSLMSFAAAILILAFILERVFKGTDWLWVYIGLGMIAIIISGLINMFISEPNKTLRNAQYTFASLLGVYLTVSLLYPTIRQYVVEGSLTIKKEGVNKEGVNKRLSVNSNTSNVDWH